MPNKLMLSLLGVLLLIMLSVVLVYQGQLQKLSIDDSQVLSAPVPSVTNPIPTVDNISASIDLAPKDPAENLLEATITPDQAVINGLNLSDPDARTDELVRDLQTLNKDLGILLNTPDFEAYQYDAEANQALTEALALIRKVDAEHGLSSLKKADAQWQEITQNITDPELLNILDEGSQLNAEVDTIIQSLQ